MCRLKVEIKSKVFSLKQRIIEQWDHQNNIFYSVWLSKGYIDVHAQYPRNEPDISMSGSMNDSSFIKSLSCELIGRIEVNYAYRFYEMENKEP
jgi:hypothetical protein